MNSEPPEKAPIDPSRYELPDEPETELTDPTEIDCYDLGNSDTPDDLEYESNFIVDIIYSIDDIAKAIQELGDTSYAVTECRARLFRINPELQLYFDQSPDGIEAVVDISYEILAGRLSVNRFSFIPPVDSPEVCYEFDIPHTFISVYGDRLYFPAQEFGNSIISDALQMIVPLNKQASPLEIAHSLYDCGINTSRIATWTDSNIIYEFTELSTTNYSSKELQISISYPNDDGSLVKLVVTISDKVSDNPEESGCSLKIEETIGMPVFPENGRNVDGTSLVRDIANETDEIIIREAIETLLEKAGPIELD